MADCGAKIILTEERISILQMNPYTLGMWSITTPFVVTKPGAAPSKTVVYQNVKGLKPIPGDFEVDEELHAPDSKSAILQQFHLFSFHVLFSVASCAT